MTIARVALFVAALAGRAHPLHTTLTELQVDDAKHSVRATVRVFADDFGTASARAKAATSDAYVAAALSIAEGSGRRVALRPCGTRRTGDLLWICVEGTIAGPARELRVANALLCDLFDDQVNIVQIALGAERRSVLFTRGDGLKRLF